MNVLLVGKSKKHLVSEKKLLALITHYITITYKLVVHALLHLFHHVHAIDVIFFIIFTTHTRTKYDGT